MITAQSLADSYPESNRLLIDLEDMASQESIQLNMPHDIVGPILLYVNLEYEYHNNFSLYLTIYNQLKLDFSAGELNEHTEGDVPIINALMLNAQTPQQIEQFFNVFFNPTENRYRFRQYDIQKYLFSKIKNLCIVFQHSASILVNETFTSTLCIALTKTTALETLIVMPAVCVHHRHRHPAVITLINRLKKLTQLRRVNLGEMPQDAQPSLYTNDIDSLLAINKNLTQLDGLAKTVPKFILRHLKKGINFPSIKKILSALTDKEHQYYLVTLMSSGLLQITQFDMMPPQAIVAMSAKVKNHIVDFFIDIYRRLIVIFKNGSVEISHLNNSKPSYTLNFQKETIKKVVLSQDHGMLAIATNQRITIFELGFGMNICELNESSVRDMIFCDKDNHLMIVGETNIKFWNTHSKVISLLAPHQQNGAHPITLITDKDGFYVALQQSCDSVIILDAIKKKKILDINLDQTKKTTNRSIKFTAMAFISERTALITCSSSNEMIYWPLDASCETKPTIPCRHTAIITKWVNTEHYCMAITIDTACPLFVYNKNFTQKIEIQNPGDHLFIDATSTPDGKYIIAIEKDTGIVFIWQRATSRW
jgi:hypothetical protein